MNIFPSPFAKQHSAWLPVLEGKSKEEARDALHDIASELRKRAANEKDPSMGSGLAGLALLFASLFELEQSETDGDCVVDCLQRAIEEVVELEHSSFYGGIVGVGWVTQRIAGRIFDVEDAEELNELFDNIDNSLLDFLAGEPLNSDYDLINGIVGCGVYLLDRPQNEVVTSALSRIVDLLDTKGEIRDDGLAWHTPSELLPQWQRQLAPNGYYNLGLAHGVPGIIAFLAHAFRADIDQQRVSRLLSGAVHWVLAQEENPKTHDFPGWIAPGGEQRDSYRLAWCYGQLGIGVSLLLAARSTHNMKWESAAISILKEAATRTFETSGVKDTGLCHGSAGVAHLFNRVFQATGEQTFGDAARRWFEQTLSMRDLDLEVAGFPAFFFDPQAGREHYLPKVGLLEGACGVALALQSAVFPVEPTWDRCLLVS